VVNGGLVIDLSRMRDVIDPEAWEEPLSTIQNTRVRQHDDQRWPAGPMTTAMAFDS
jgi:hypothetical protein